MITLYEEAARKSYQNALDLQKDARLLYDKKRYARAYALSILSIEELSKAYLFKAVSEGRIVEKRAKLLKKAILDHSVKLNMLAFLLGVSQLSSETASYLNKADIKNVIPPASLNEDVSNFVKVLESFEKFAKVKFKALYVDIDESGVVISPKSEVTKENSQMVVYLAERIIKAIPLELNKGEGRSRLLSMLVSEEFLAPGRAKHIQKVIREKKDA